MTTRSPFRLVLTLIGCAWFALARAETTAPVPTAPMGVAEESSLTTAKQSFDVLIQRGESRNEKNELPRISVAPEFPSTTSPLPLHAKPALTPKKGSRNWLVEGVMGKIEDKPGLPDDSSDLTETSLEGNLDLRGPTARKFSDQKKSGLVPHEATNPLSTYMKGWLSPQDRGANTAQPFIGGIEYSPRADASGLSMTTLPPSAPRMNFLPSTKENPYLAAQPTELSSAFAPSIPAQKPEVGLPPTKLLFVPLATTAPALSPLASAPKSNLVRPVEDQKYFPQLKRF